MELKPQQSKKRPTLVDIAKEAGVSASTVSLVLRDKDTKRVGYDTRNRIIKIASRLNYKPNLQARSLVGRGSRTIGLVLTTLANPVYVEMMQGIIHRATEERYGVIASSVDDHGLKGERRSVFDLIARGVDGLIICSVLRKDKLIDELIQQRIPFVLVGRMVDRKPSDPSIDYIIPNDQRGAAMAVEHLLKLGYKRLAVILGPQDTSSGYNRRMGALAAIKAYGIRKGDVLMLQGDYKRESGYKLAQKIVGMKDKPDAVYSSNDIMAIGLLHAFADKGIRVPEDIAIVGYDDIEMVGLPGVDLTTICFRRDAMGALAVDRLIEKIKGGSSDIVTRTLLDPILTIRKTCGFYQKGGVYTHDQSLEDVSDQGGA
jgi:LacI family transcriptional regulator, galactose operon repressor